MNAAARLALLHEAMDGLREMLDRGHIDTMPQMLDAYEGAVREFCTLPGAAALREGVQALHDRHHDTIALMRARQDELLDLMRRQRQSSRALHAYAGTEAG